MAWDHKQPKVKNQETWPVDFPDPPSSGEAKLWSNSNGRDDEGDIAISKIFRASVIVQRSLASRMPGMLQGHPSVAQSLPEPEIHSLFVWTFTVYTALIGFIMYRGPLWFGQNSAYCNIESCHSCVVSQSYAKDPTLLNLSGPVGDDFFKASTDMMEESTWHSRTMWFSMYKTVLSKLTGYGGETHWGSSGEDSARRCQLFWAMIIPLVVKKLVVKKLLKLW